MVPLLTALVSGQSPTKAIEDAHGAQEIHLSPFYVAAQLNQYEFKGKDQADRFSRQAKYQRFVNYQPDTPATSSTITRRR